MLITYLQDSDLLKVEGVELSDTSIYTNIAITSSLNCNIVLLKSETLLETVDTTNVFYITNNVLYIKPALFGLSSFTDGIYKMDIKFIKTNGYTLAENCIFVDVTYKCKVAAYLQNLIEENASLDKSEQIGNSIHLLHYGLINGSNCGCNCIDLCNLFYILKDLLLTTNPINTDCGC